MPAPPLWLPMPGYGGPEEPGAKIAFMSHVGVRTDLVFASSSEGEGDDAGRNCQEVVDEGL